MISLFESILLGIIQGIAEWLPIYSSGHLALAQNFFGIQAPVVYDVLLHLGTLLVVLIVFWSDFVKTVKAFFTFNFKSEYGKLSLFIILGSVITAIIGFTFRDLFKSFFHNTLIVGIALIVTGFILYVSKFFRQRKNLNWKHSVWMGLAQGLAIIPGISRSGSTISIGLIAGVKREKLISFSFLLSIPAIIGASVLEFGSLNSDVSFVSILVGLLVSIVVGYFALRWVVKLIKNKGFHNFAWYCWAVGLIVVILISVF